MSYEIRKATLQDKADLEKLISHSVRQLCVMDYTKEQIEGALRGAFGVDTQLIRDGSYYVVESDGNIIGCGGWSRRITLFGGDSHTDRSPTQLDPSTDPAKIRAYFVAPEYTRKGIGTMILRRCESDAYSYGFTRLKLMATISGARLYSNSGYIPENSIQYELEKGLSIEFIPMTKAIIGEAEKSSNKTNEHGLF